MCVDKKTLALLHTNRAELIALSAQIFTALSSQTSRTPLSFLAEHVRYLTLVEQRVSALRLVTDLANSVEIRNECYLASRCKSELVEVLEAVPLTDAAEVLAARRIRSVIMP